MVTAALTIVNLFFISQWIVEVPRRENILDKMDPKFIEKAKVELREDEFRKTQALAQMRDWISKHPFLKGIRQGMLSMNIYKLNLVNSRKQLLFAEVDINEKANKHKIISNTTLHYF